MNEASLGRLLVFRVGNLACAAEVDQVREILPRLPTTRIPGAPPVVAGLVNVRGTLVTVVEGWRALGQSPPSPTPTPALPAGSSQDNGGGERQGSTIILDLGKVREGEEGHRLVGFTVDEVTDMLAAGDAQLEDRRGLAGVDPTLVRAVGRRGEGQIFVVLDVAALLGPILTT
ncbi:MAG: chemotaxis protein CheW [Gemmatimonadales bacterium]